MKMDGIKLYVECEPGIGECQTSSGLIGADGFVIHPEDTQYLSEDSIDDKAFIYRDRDPSEYHERQFTGQEYWVVGADLELACRYRDQWPELCWLPRIAVYRQETMYHFTPESMGDGFRFYTPDPATIHNFLTVPQDLALSQVMDKAQELGFETVWLHGQGAALEGKGLELDLIEITRAVYSGQLWLSGGVSTPGHLDALVREGGATAVVVPCSVVKSCGCEQLLAALEPGAGPSATVNVTSTDSSGQLLTSSG